CTMSLTAKPRASQARASERSSTHFSQRRVFGAEKASAPARASDRSRKVANTAGTDRDYFAFSSASASATRRWARAAAASKSTRGGNPSRCATSSEESEVPAEKSWSRRKRPTSLFAYQSSPKRRRIPSCIIPARANAPGVVGRVERIVDVGAEEVRFLLGQLERVGDREELPVQLAKIVGLLRRRQQRRRGRDLGG